MFNSYLYLFCFILFFFFKQKTAYEMRISDWSSDVCSSDLNHKAGGFVDSLSRAWRDRPPHPPASPSEAGPVQRRAPVRRRAGSPPQTHGRRLGGAAGVRGRRNTHKGESTEGTHGTTAGLSAEGEEEVCRGWRVRRGGER